MSKVTDYIDQKVKPKLSRFSLKGPFKFNRPVMISALVAALIVGGLILRFSFASSVSVTLSVAPTGDATKTNVHGVVNGNNTNTNLYQTVDDGTNFNQADDLSTYVQTDLGVRAGIHATSYSGIPTGTVTQVVSNVRAKASAPSTKGSFRILLYDGANLVGTGSQHTLSRDFANFSDTFSNLNVSNGNALIARLEFSDTTPKLTDKDALLYTQVWLAVTYSTPDSPPTITITQPTNGSTVKGTVNVTGVAGDDNGVAKVEVQIDNGAFNLASGTNSWTYVWDSTKVADGSHTITARATDTAGQTTVSSVAVNVVNGSGVTRAFSASSEWNKPLPVGAPIDPNSATYIAEIKGFNPAIQFPKLVAGDWAMPIYWSSQTDKQYNVKPSHYALPPEFASLRIPAGAQPMHTSDGAMTIWDLQKGYVAGLHQAVYDSVSDTWTAESGDIYYLPSNGLIHTLPESDEPRNIGHRGYSSALSAVRWDEIQAGAINHVLKIDLDKTGACTAYPGDGYELNRGGTICEGAILRIKPSIDLAARGLSGAALIVAKAMQTYGVVVGDTGGIPMELKLENLSLEGSPHNWSQVSLGTDSLSKITFDDFEVIKLGYHRP